MRLLSIPRMLVRERQLRLPFVLIVALTSAAHAQDAPPPDAPDLLPRHAMASCMANGCSGTIVSKGEHWASGITACHCFFDKLGRQTVSIGGKIPLKFIDGSTAEGRLLYLDYSVDMARFAAPSRAVLAVSPVALGTPDRARYESIGFPGWDANKQSIPYEKRRPFYFLLSPHRDSVVHFGGAMYRWHFNVDRGGTYPGVSGSGIFANGQLIGVLSNNNGHYVATECYCSTPDQIAAFLRKSDQAGCDKWQLGSWSEKAVNFADAPPALSYANDSNRPLYQCRNGHCWQILEKPQPVPPPPPPDAGHDKQQQSEDNGSGSSGAVVINPGKDAEGYDGKGRPPKDLRGPHKRSAGIDELNGRVYRLEELLSHGVPPGEQGPPGNDGKDGQDLVPVLKHSNAPPILPLVAVLFGSFCVFVAVVVAVLIFHFIIQAMRSAHTRTAS